MLGIVLIYWIGKYFYKLAEKYSKNNWLYAIIGVVVYFVSQMFVGVILGLIDLLLNLGIDFDSVALNLLGIPIGIGADYLFYIFLERKWEKEFDPIANQIKEIGKRDDD